MSIKEQLAEDMKIAMREKDTIRKNTIQMCRAGILQVEKDTLKTLDEDGVLEVIARELKRRRDALPEFEKSGRQDLIEGLEKEIEVLLNYLPTQLSDEELTEIVRSAIDETGATSGRDMGKIMAIVMPQTKGRADGKRINQTAMKLLS